MAKALQWGAGLACVFWMLAGSARAQYLDVVTEDYPPYNYEENGTAKGVSTEVVEAVLKEAGIRYKITVYPWARALRKAEKEENTLIYSISRTAKREQLYTWVGVIGSIDFYIYSLSSRADIPPMTRLDEAKPYRVGVVNQDALHQLLAEKQFPHLDKAFSNETNLRQLTKGGIDLWPISEFTMLHLARKHGVARSEFKQVYNLKGFADGAQWMALSNATDKATLTKLQRALEKIKADGRYEAILSRYR